jgi:UDP-GlcNAc:undecaprenyl-phosphate GlcNAc-1-phosphate transferase
LYYFIIFLITLSISYFLFRPALAISCFCGAIDIPENRKIHTKPMARGGGWEFFMAFSSILIFLPIKNDLKIPLLIGGTIIFVVGFLDDTLNLPPFTKLSGQFLVLSIYFFTSELLNYKMSMFQGIFSAIWIIFLINATNFIDGIDGLASGISSSQALCISVISLICNNIDIFLCSILILGATLGFIPRNFPKAKIFMGDCGALFLGFVQSVLSSRIVLESESILCIISILLVFRIPIYDASFSIIRRLIKRKNPFKADKEHFHHKLLIHGFSKECTTLLLVTFSLLFGFLGVLLLLFDI